MAKVRFKKLRVVGEWGGVLANILVFLGTNWLLTAGVIVSIGVGLWD
jgi:hypothetical protein